MKSGKKADCIALSGSGEPSLHTRLGMVLKFIRMNSNLPAALLTNGTMLWLPEVRMAASRADIVKVSLSAWDQASFEWVNRPHPRLRFDKVIDGIVKFRSIFKGELWLEVFLIDGMNAAPSEVEKIAALAKEIGPDRVHLNTAVRPPSEDFAKALPQSRLSELTDSFQPTAEVIPDCGPNTGEKGGSMNRWEILSIIERRPCTAGHISSASGLHLNEVTKHLGELMRSRKVRTSRTGSDIFYLPVKSPPAPGSQSKTIHSLKEG
jgi:wyosine [tRNA(Phe)-imidazoG37] synthetase (radical SAM superfamily)